MNDFPIYQQEPTYRRQYHYTESESNETEPIFLIDLGDETSGLFMRDGIFWVETDMRMVSKQMAVGYISYPLVKSALDNLLFTTLKWYLPSDVSSKYLTSPLMILQDYNRLVEDDGDDDDDGDDGPKKISFFDAFNLSSNRELLKLWIKMQ